MKMSVETTMFKGDKMKTITKILKIKGDWEEVVNDCRFTVNKSDLGKEPSDRFKKHILIAEHSPIRDISFKWEWLHIPHWVTVHWVRHKWEKFVATQRSDRTGVDRHTLPQDVEQNMRGEANIQSLIDTMRKRLCLQASTETRICAESLKKEIKKEGEKYISDVLVPNCVYRGGCPEYEKDNLNRCKFYENLMKDFKGDSTNIQERYDHYNNKFYERCDNETV